MSVILELWVLENGEERLLPGLTDYNQNQLFWIRNAHRLCSHHSKEIYERRVANSTHTPPKYRILVSMMLSDKFAKDFNCPSNSTMNPTKECQIGSLWPESLLKKQSWPCELLKDTFLFYFLCN